MICCLFDAKPLPEAIVTQFQWNIDWNLKIFIQEIHFKMLSAKWKPFCCGPDEIRCKTFDVCNTHLSIVLYERLHQYIRLICDLGNVFVQGSCFGVPCSSSSCVNVCYMKGQCVFASHPWTKMSCCFCHDKHWKIAFCCLEFGQSMGEIIGSLATNYDSKFPSVKVFYLMASWT